MDEIFTELVDDGAPYHCQHRAHKLDGERVLAVKALTQQAWQTLRTTLGKDNPFYMRAICEEHAKEAMELLSRK